MNQADMEGLEFITLREKPTLKDAAAEWFHSKCTKHMH